MINLCTVGKQPFITTLILQVFDVTAQQMKIAANLENHTVSHESRTSTTVHAKPVLYLLEIKPSAFQVRF
jgi:hypothetical protein